MWFRKKETLKQKIELCERIAGIEKEERIKVKRECVYCGRKVFSDHIVIQTENLMMHVHQDCIEKMRI